MSRQQRIRTIGSGRYEVSDEVLGEGSFGKVHSGRNVFMKEDVAVKVVHKNGLSRYMRQRLAAELQIHTKIQHTNIVKMHDVVDEGDVIYLIFEHLSGGDMFDYVINNGRLDEAEARRLFVQLCQALDHCHSNSIIHHDVKLENCMLKKSESGISLKLVDFGLSCLCVAGQKLQTFSGTEAYCAAEILAGRPYDGKLIDAYSAGVLLYICLTGAYPFSQDLEAQHREQNDSRYLAALPFPECVSKEAQDLVLQLIQPTPEKRLTIQDALKHPFLSAQQTDTRVESHEVFMQMQEEEDDEFAFEATSGIDEEEEEDEEMPLECSAWEEEEWNMLSEEFGEAGSWEDRMTPDCKPL